MTDFFGRGRGPNGLGPNDNLQKALDAARTAMAGGRPAPEPETPAGPGNEEVLREYIEDMNSKQKDEVVRLEAKIIELTADKEDMQRTIDNLLANVSALTAALDGVVRASEAADGEN